MEKRVGLRTRRADARARGPFTARGARGSSDRRERHRHRSARARAQARTSPSGFADELSASRAIGELLPEHASRGIGAEVRSRTPIRARSLHRQFLARRQHPSGAAGAHSSRLILVGMPTLDPVEEERRRRGESHTLRALSHARNGRPRALLSASRARDSFVRQNSPGTGCSSSAIRRAACCTRFAPATPRTGSSTAPDGTSATVGLRAVSRWRAQRRRASGRGPRRRALQPPCRLSATPVVTPQRSLRLLPRRHSSPP